ncbi:D-alanyl-D-alanine carboxypeptidase family protein [Amphibiibacter pelophylacis]|uniref:D-alanyl-D-alanine carboxypeptidase family protein n=1 Tax=Amphibiibacter pelophylacis TaxID=1799477 RepID=A0ACC6NXY5_9BURK
MPKPAGAATAAVVTATGVPAPAVAAPIKPPEIAAKSYFLLDVSSNQVLADHNADVRADPASLTKLMTAYVVFDALKQKKISLDQRLPVSQKAWDERKYGSSLMFIDPKMTPTVDQLLSGLIIQSGNDAAVALAEGVAGSTDVFVQMMNAQAKAWGLANTQFANPTGLTQEGHYSSARDIATIATRIIRDFPEYYHYYSTREYTFNNIKQPNRNQLLYRDPTVDGMKTGYTSAAGYCLVATAKRALPNGNRRVMSVVMGTASMAARANEAQKLLNWGYQAFDFVRLFDKDATISVAPVWQGKDSEVSLRTRGGYPVYVSVPRGEAQKLKSGIERLDPLVAPLAKDQKVGLLKVTTASGAPVAQFDLVTSNPVEQAGLFGRLWDSLRMRLKW